jgi:membrane fusion protein, heavy metal efflux system
MVLTLRTMPPRFTLIANLIATDANSKAATGELATPVAVLASAADLPLGVEPSSAEHAADDASTDDRARISEQQHSSSRGSREGRPKLALLLSLGLSAVALAGCNQTPSGTAGNKIPKTVITPNSSNPDLLELSSDAVANAAIACESVKSVSYEAEIRTTGELKADENRVFHINSMVGGRITSDRVNLGDVIQAGQILCQVQNLEVAKLLGEYIHQKHSNEVQVDQIASKIDLAQKNVDRLSKLVDEGIAPQKDLLTAKNLLDQLKIELRGVKEHNIHLKSETEALLSTYGRKLGNFDGHTIDSESPLTSPRAGVVIKKTITLGDVVNTSEPLYIVADLSEIWLDITIYDKDLSRVSIGEEVTFTTDSLPGRKFNGHISYIQPLAGDTTRTFLARAVLPNKEIMLKPGMFGTAVIHTQKGETMPYLPDKTIQRYGREIFVFVDTGNNHFLKKQVELGDRILDGYLIKSGISVGERVVNSGSLTLKAELLKRLNGSAE